MELGVGVLIPIFPWKVAQMLGRETFETGSKYHRVDLQLIEMVKYARE